MRRAPQFLFFLSHSSISSQSAKKCEKKNGGKPPSLFRGWGRGRKYKRVLFFFFLRCDFLSFFLSRRRGEEEHILSLSLFSHTRRREKTQHSHPTLSSSSCGTSSGRYAANDSIPTSSQALTLDRTYVSESPRAPTSTTARPGALPVAATSSFTPAAISPRMVAAMALPSMMEADDWEEGASAGGKEKEGSGGGGFDETRRRLSKKGEKLDQSAKKASLFLFLSRVPPLS